MYTTGGRGGDERIFFGGGFLKLFEGKRGDGKNLLRQEGGEANVFRCH